MGKLMDIKSTLSQKRYRDKLTMQERAELLCEICEDNDINEYTNLSGERDINRAMKELSKTDTEMHKIEKHYE